MSRIKFLSILLVYSTFVTAQNESINKEILNGNWVLRGVRIVPGHYSYRNQVRDSFKWTNVLYDSSMVMHFAEDKATLIKKGYLKNDTAIYNLSIDENFIRLSKPKKGRKNKIDYRRRFRYTVFGNNSIVLRERVFSDINNRSLFGSSSEYEYSFIKQPDSTFLDALSLLQGDWFSGKKMSFLESDTLEFSRDSVFLRIDTIRSSSKNIIEIKHHFGLLTLNAESKMSFDYDSKYIKFPQIKNNPNASIFEDWVYPHTAVKGEGSYNYVIYPKASIINVYSRYKNISFRYSVTNGRLVLIKLSIF